jgi:hypothetical protein
MSWERRVNGNSIAVLVIVLLFLLSATGMFTSSDGERSEGGDNSKSPGPGVLKPIWLKEFVGRDYDRPAGFLRTSDGGYLIAATTLSFSFNKGEIWLIKVDGNGNELWNRIIGAAGSCSVEDMIETNDGGYLLAGGIVSTKISDTFELYINPVNMWLLKIDVDGNELWNRTTGGSRGDIISSIAASTDGGYIMVGSTESYAEEGMALLDLPNTNIWMIKVDENGVEEWNRTFGTEHYEYATDVCSTGDGGFMLLANRYYEEDQNFSTDAMLIATDSNGAMTRNVSYGDISNITLGNAFQPTTDGGYVLVGSKKDRNNGSRDLWLCKLNSSGGIEWDDLYGGIDGEVGTYVHMTENQSFVITGYSRTPNPRSESDLLLIEYDDNGKVVRDRALDLGGSEVGYCILPADDGGYLILGSYTKRFDNRADILLFKIDGAGGEGIDHSGNLRPDCYIDSPQL